MDKSPPQILRQKIDAQWKYFYITNISHIILYKINIFIKMSFYTVLK